MLGLEHDETFFTSTLCQSHLPAVSKAALDMITFRLTRPDRPQCARTGINGVIPPLAKASSKEAVEDSDPGNGHANGGFGARDEREGGGGAAEDGVDEPMEILKDGGAILAAMRAHPTDARVQESGWRSLLAMDTGRGDVEKFFAGDGHERGREMLKDCIERHGGDSAVAGHVAEMLERLVLQGDSGKARRCTRGGVPQQFLLSLLF